MIDEVTNEQSVKFIRLNNGDDVIAEVVEVGEDGQIDYMLINPLKVIYVPSERGSSFLQVAFMPWVFPRICDEQEFLVHAEDVVTMSNVSESMSNYYWKNLDHFIGNAEEYTTDEPEEEEHSSESIELESLLEALKASRRTYH